MKQALAVVLLSALTVLAVAATAFGWVNLQHAIGTMDWAETRGEIVAERASDDGLQRGVVVRHGLGEAFVATGDKQLRPGDIVTLYVDPELVGDATLTSPGSRAIRAIAALAVAAGIAFTAPVLYRRVWGHR